MTFRARLRLAFLAVVLVPMVILALGVRKAVTDRLTAQYERRVDALVSIIREDITQESAAIARILASLRAGFIEDNRLRLALVTPDPSERTFLLDYAGDAMRLTGLSMLQMQDESGRIVSSGHFRNEYDRLEPGLPKLLASIPEGLAFVQARTAEAPFLALARVDSFSFGGKPFTLVGGVAVEPRFFARLARDEELTVSLIYPDGVLSSAASPPGQPGAADSAIVESDSGSATPVDRVVGELAVLYIDNAVGVGAVAVLARILVTNSLTELEALRRSIDLWFVIALAITALGALFLAGWLSSRISRPLTELAQKTSRIDLDRLDIEFDSGRKDEVGALSRLLGSMTDRLRTSAGRLKEAERRATLGELARQVNHDIKNGLTPIRNVVHHLAQVARRDPHHLPEVFDERQGTLDSGIAYLENLATNYARLYPRLDRRPCDVNDVIRRLIGDAQGSVAADLRTKLAEGLPLVLADRVVIRRILENLLANALDSLDDGAGLVTISTASVAAGPGAGAASLRIAVADSGRGMTEDEISQIFDDFYTTKDDGTGLGLSIVRRLVMDLNGSIRVESAAGAGSRFVLELPCASA